MEWQINFKEKYNLLYVRTKGKFTLKDFQKMSDELVANERWAPGMNCIFNHSDIDWGEVDTDTLFDLIHIHKDRNELIGDGKTALVMEGNLAFGIGRQYQNISEDELLSKIEVFKNEEDAFNWIVN